MNATSAWFIWMPRYCLLAECYTWTHRHFHMFFYTIIHLSETHFIVWFYSTFWRFTVRFIWIAYFFLLIHHYSFNLMMMIAKYNNNKMFCSIFKYSARWTDCPYLTSSFDMCEFYFNCVECVIRSFKCNNSSFITAYWNSMFWGVRSTLLNFNNYPILLKK